MSPSSAPHSESDYAKPIVRPLGVSNYDRVASSLVALLLIIGFFVLLLLILFLSSRVLAGRAPVNVEMLEDFGGRGENPMGSAEDFKPPGVEELTDLTEPQTAAALAAVTEAISSQVASLTALDGDAFSHGTGAGDRRQAGPGGDSDVLPPWERWRIQFDATKTTSYARQLDFFGIELAAIQSGQQQIEYVSGFSQSSPTRRVGTWDDEDRIYMSWVEGQLSAVDRQLVAKSGISSRGKMVVQFYSKELYSNLLSIEAAKLGSRKLREVKRTNFGVRPAGRGYEFFVMKQEYR